MILPIIEAPRHLFEASGKVLHGNLMTRANYAALEQRERRFDYVRRDAHLAFVVHVFFRSVIPALMLRIVVRRRGEVIEL